MLKKIKNKKKYIFIPTDNWTDDMQILENKNSKEKIVKLDTIGKLIVTDFPFVGFGKIIRESYNDYLKTLSLYNPEKDQWIYNIIDGIAEQEKVLYRDSHVVIVIDYLWNGQDLHTLHILALPTDKNLRCIRSLSSSHINLLIHCKNKTCEIIKNKYNIDKDQLKMYFHYPPSVFHLHIHFATIYNVTANSSIEYTHELSSVIYNLDMDTNYYKKIILNKRI